ncbi:MAG: MDR family MFS transporter [Deltaproteobacteria bacterium]
MGRRIDLSEGNNRRLVVGGLLLGILMASMDNTIVATAMGTIVSELGGMDKFVWVTSAYMIASVAGMPIWGKLSDMYGRKLFYLSGLLLFIAGSMLCGTAQDMTQLILYRGLQGLGGGALMPIAFTIIFDIFPPAERGRVSGLFGAVFGLSAIFGPLLGAYLTDYANWRWVFYVNMPLGFISLLLLFKFYHESLKHRAQKIDWLGSVLLVASVLSLMLALQLGAKGHTWESPRLIVLLGSFILCLILFLWVERRVTDPVIQLGLFKDRLFAFSQGTALLYGAVFILCTVYIPIYVQGVFGGSATGAGFILMPMMLGSVAGSQVGGANTRRASYRNIMLISGLLLLLGVTLLGSLSAATPRWMVTIYMIITGMGVGVSFPVLAMSSVHDLDFNLRGSANAQVAFFRTIGMTLGISIFGSVQSHLFISGMKNAFPGVHVLNSVNDSRFLLQPAVRAQIPPNVLEKLTAILAASIDKVFQYSLITVLLALICIILMGNARLQVGTGPVPSHRGGEDNDVYEADSPGSLDGGGEASL